MTTLRLRHGWLLTALLVASLGAASGCGSNAGPSRDAGTTDGDTPDGGTQDTGVVDAGLDSDNDGVPDDQEVIDGTDPNDPDSDDDGLDDGDEDNLGTDPNDSDSDDDGLLDGDEVELGTDPNVPDNACGEASSMSTLVRRPVDVIIVIDNSSSMDQEIAGVVSNISESFADILDTSAIDYRIILISSHGPPDVDPSGPADDLICITAPLSTTDCNPAPAQPGNTERFRHYSAAIDSEDSLARVLATFAVADEFNLAPTGWGAWLRPDAQRVFLEITDDTSNITANAFRTGLYALPGTPFGTSEAPNFVFHSIIGVVEKTDPTEAYAPNEPLVTAECSTAADLDNRYQTLSIDSGGLRFPVCQTASYDAVFERIAEGVVIGSQVECTFPSPTAAMNTVLDFTRVVVTYLPGVGANETLTRVANEAACVDGAFFVDGETVELCPATCDRIKLDPAAEVEVDVACEFDFG